MHIKLVKNNQDPDIRSGDGQRDAETVRVSGPSSAEVVPESQDKRAPGPSSAAVSTDADAKLQREAQAAEEAQRNEAIARKVALAKTDETTFESLVGDFEIHMRKTAYRTVGHYIDQSDDEWSVVLLAFHEAVQRYAPDKGTFTAFADMVIKRRLIDEIRRQARRRDEVSVDMTAADEFIMADTTDRQQERQSALKLEIEAISEVLEKYAISFSDLAECSPKAGRTRKQCGRVINLLTEDRELLEAMRAGGRLPVKKIIEKGKIPPKILERHRKYIIVAVEITVGDYPHLDEYIKRIRTEGRS